MGLWCLSRVMVRHVKGPASSIKQLSQTQATERDPGRQIRPQRPNPGQPQKPDQACGHTRASTGQASFCPGILSVFPCASHGKSCWSPRHCFSHKTCSERIFGVCIPRLWKWQCKSVASFCPDIFPSFRPPVVMARVGWWQDGQRKIQENVKILSVSQVMVTVHQSAFDTMRLPKFCRGGYMWGCTVHNCEKSKMRE